MNYSECTVEDLELFAAAMAKMIPELECPECCECGWTYQYMESSAFLFKDDWEWACLALVLRARCDKSRRSPGSSAL